MALYDDPPHSVGIYSSTSSTDSGGGTALAYTLVQSAVGCSINTATADTVSLYDRQQIKVTHTVGFLRSVLTTDLVPGMKLVAADDGGTFRIEGIRPGRQYGGVPAFSYADCSELL